MTGEECTSVGGCLPQRVEWRGEPVLTTADAARGLGAEEGNLRRNFARNEDRFREGEHFVRLTGSELKAFKNSKTDCLAVGSKAKEVVLWTKRGVARHAKMLGTDQAWDCYEALERAYFDGVRPGVDPIIAALDQARETRIRQIALEQAQAALERRVTEIEQITGQESEWVTIIGACNIAGVTLSEGQASVAGRRAASMTRAAGHEPQKVHSQVWGRVGLYPKDIALSAITKTVGSA